MQICKHANMQIRKYANVQIHKYNEFMIKPYPPIRKSTDHTKLSRQAQGQCNSEKVARIERRQNEKLAQDVLDAQSPTTMLSLSGVHITATSTMAEIHNAYDRLSTRIRPENIQGCAHAAAAFQALESARDSFQEKTVSKVEDGEIEDENKHYRR